jgi:hypothetical protein
VVADSGSAWVDRDDADLAEWVGNRGWQVERVKAKDLERGRVPVDEHTLVVGSIQTVRAALRMLDISLPDPDDYPAVLEPHFHRRIWPSTVGNLQRQLDDGLNPVFAKPKQLKRFTGRVFEHPDDRRFLNGLSATAELWCSEVVNWRSEWRVFVVDREVVGIRHYTGEPWTTLDRTVVTDCVERLAQTDDAPAGYAVDLGVLSDSTTALIERNDGFSVGAYGLETPLYAQMLMARWQQLLHLAGRDPAAANES